MKAGRMFKMVIGLAILSVLFISTSSFAAEEKWPTRPITIYIGYAPGGGMDMMGRILSEEMRKTLGVAMPVVNMTGANSAIAMDHVYKQPKDGYTLFGISSAVSTFPATGLSKLTYKEFGMIGIVFDTLPTFSVPWDSPIKTAKDLIEGFKKGNLTGSNSGIGGMWHVPQLIVMNTLGAKFKAVPYEGGAPSAMAVAKKEVDFGTSDLSEALTVINSKMVRPLFVFDDKPFNLEGFGVIPPITEFVPQMKDKLSAGKGFRALGYAKGIPEDRIKKLIDAFKIAMASDAVKNFGQKTLLPLNGIAGADADKVWAIQTQVQAWLLFDIKEAKKNPEELGIPRPGK
ncbi:MAG: tripartite tricarboxylate transporter substrate binding protein [Desulfobacterales bacterium]|nr:tripartite tricarboxylate transporter substrate binding protein [Desulfobacterales bacterium]